MCRRVLDDEELGPILTSRINYSAEIARLTSAEDERRSLLIQEWSRATISADTCLTLAIAYLETLGVVLFSGGGVYAGSHQPRSSKDALGTFTNLVMTMIYDVADAYLGDQLPIEEDDGPSRPAVVRKLD
jgi:hypothetical protein